MKMKTRRRIAKTITSPRRFTSLRAPAKPGLTVAPRQLRRSYGSFDFTDATIEPEPASPPEAVFDRLTGPYGRRSGGFDEET